MTKETLMQLARQYARFYMTFDETIAKQKLSDAIDVALAQARSDALEEVLSLPQIKGNLFAEDAIRALKGTQIVRPHDLRANFTDIDTPDHKVEGSLAEFDRYIAGDR